MELLNEQLKKMQKKSSEFPEKQEEMYSLELLKDRFVALASVGQEAKHEARRNISLLSKRLSDVSKIF